MSSSALECRLANIACLPRFQCPNCRQLSLIQDRRNEVNKVCVICDYKEDNGLPFRDTRLIRPWRADAMTLDVEFPDRLCCVHPDCQAKLELYPELRLWTSNASCGNCGQTYSIKQLHRALLSKDFSKRNIPN